MAEKTISLAEKTISLREKLMRIQTEIKAPKNLYNSFGKYKYRNAESILEALKPLEAKYRVSFILENEIIGIGDRIYVKAIATIMDIDTEETISTTAYAREAESKKGMDEAQVTGSTSSYANKYCLNMILLLDDTQDVDTESYQAEKKRATAKPKTEDMPVEVVDSRTELRNFIKANGLDGNAIIQACGLNNDSTEEDYAIALVYAKGIMGGIA